ncbi:MAG: glycosyl hydrolase [candidate division KSB1 bacterium]|nr:glycosyl hydrolase [candidate division KSB1 bacterium]MDZ7364461.1 glycosyl hydrolase [candidate division KSB1 bacterium]MDZ7402833.1 glycosyl hydrolase [candidate division KSB1 bacterium]
MRNGSWFFKAICLTFAVLFISADCLAQTNATTALVYDTTLYKALQWRNIGPFRGGRVCAVAGVPSQPLTYYFGATGGGVWKTEDAGLTWKNISDGFFKTGSVGAIAVADADPNVIYVGMGEAAIRGVATSHGDGVYKSTDAGKTWKHLGLENTRQISTIRIHPKNPDLVYVAAQGSIWNPNPERGIYRSKDGGKTWELVLPVNTGTGASDLSMDVNNPRILYAAFWEHQRKPWKIISGGPGSGIYKTTDGGDTWQKLTEGLPEMMGKIAVAVSPKNSERVWALIEAEKGGLYRSDNGGKNWQLINSKRVLRARAWYYIEVFADPQDEETVYVLNAPMLKSVDGGRNFRTVPTPHGDNHDLWINPANNQNLINGNDGGANISFNGGKTWSTQANQPTAQFYRVITDNRFPYYVYGGQQDNSTVAIPSRTTDGGIGREHWYAVGGCESAHVAFNPDQPDLIYAGCYQGIITEYDAATKKERNVMAEPYLGLGSDAREHRYRFNWNAPILVSPHDPNVVYHAGNILLKSSDRGQTWQEISPDLTRNEKDKQGKGGEPITNEAAGAEVYNTIFYIVESKHQAGTIWAGTDDGLVHLTRDGGKTWMNVTPKGVGEAQINAIEVSPHHPATAYLAVTRYKFGDFTPLIFKTADYGKTWTRLVNGIGPEAFVRVVREDPKRRGLLYAGTETGLYISFNDGKQWQPFQLNLPIVPITDLTIRNDDLIASTQGRAFWILDDLTPLHQINDEIAKSEMHLFKPRPAYRMEGGSADIPGVGKNPPNGAMIFYYFAKAPDTSKIEVKLDILDANDQVIRSYSSKRKEQASGEQEGPGSAAPQPLPVKAGMNRFVWDLRGENVTRVPELFVYGSLQGYKIAPGTYKARLTVGDKSMTQSFEVVQDPRIPVAPAAFQEQQSMLAAIRGHINEIHETVQRLRDVRKQIKDLTVRTKDQPNAQAIADSGKALTERMTKFEEQLVQPKQETFQDVINFPNKLNAQFLYLMSEIDSSDPPLTNGLKTRFATLNAEWEQLEPMRNRLLEQEVPRFNALFQQNAIPAVIVPKASSATTASDGEKK